MTGKSRENMWRKPLEKQKESKHIKMKKFNFVEIEIKK